MPFSSSASQNFSTIYEKLFPGDTINVVYTNLDPGVDDAIALMQLLANLNVGEKPKNKKKVNLLGVVPCVGNAVRSQTQLNALRLLGITKNNILAYEGATAPLVIEKNETAIAEMERQINETHFYGHDGLEDVGGWPKVTQTKQEKPGYQFAAQSVAQASPENPITFVSTAPLTELAKTLIEIERINEAKGLALGTLFKNINAISMMGGVFDPKQANAPFNRKHKISEENFYFDVEAAKLVFEKAQQFRIPILLAPLDLTKQPGLLWTKDQVGMLEKINNVVAKKMARVTGIVPHMDVKHFPKDTYPMHDLQATAPLLYPNFYRVIPCSITIGSEGEIKVNENATNLERNVFRYTISPELQKTFYDNVLADYCDFNNVTTKNSSFLTHSGFFSTAGSSELNQAALAHNSNHNICSLPSDNSSELQPSLIIFAAIFGSVVLLCLVGQCWGIWAGDGQSADTKRSGHTSYGSMDSPGHVGFYRRI